MIFRLYNFLFSRKIFISFNTFLLNLGLRGLGVQNYHNFKESGEQQFLTGLLAKLDDPVILDIGANEGAYSKLLLSINPQAKILAFEPNPETYARLRQNLAHTSAETYVYGFSDKQESVELWDYSAGVSTSHATLYREVIEDIQNEESKHTTIELLKLDDFIEKNLHHDYLTGGIDLLKIDTEGHELAVLKGAKELLKSQKVRTIQFEFGLHNLYSRSSFKDFLELLEDYSLYRILRHGLMPLNEYNPKTCEIYLFQNIIAIHNDIPTKTMIDQK
jgi:FkbM family methyltransferase